MMIAKNAGSQSKAASAPRTGSTWVAAAALIVALVLVLSFAAPRVAALEGSDAMESEPNRFSSQAAAIDYYVAKHQREREVEAGLSFSGQAAAIDYYLAQVQREREAMASVSFSSQAEAIDYYLASLACDSEGEASVSFSSQAEAIDHYLAQAQRDSWSVAGSSWSLVCSLAGS